MPVDLIILLRQKSGGGGGGTTEVPCRTERLIYYKHYLLGHSAYKLIRGQKYEYFMVLTMIRTHSIHVPKTKKLNYYPKNNAKHKPSRVERLSRSILQLILPPVEQNKAMRGL